MDVGDCGEKEKSSLEIRFEEWLSSLGLSEHVSLITSAGVTSFDELLRLYTVKSVFDAVILNHLSKSQQQTLIEHLDEKIHKNDNSNTSKNNNKDEDIIVNNNASEKVQRFSKQCEIISSFISCASLKCETYRSGLKESMDLNQELKQYSLMTKLNGIKKYFGDIETLLSILSHQIAKQSDICDEFIQNYCVSLYQRINHVKQQSLVLFHILFFFFFFLFVCFAL